MNHKQAIAFTAVTAVFIAVGIVQLTAPQEPLERMPDVPEPTITPSAATPSPTPSDSLSDAPLFSRQLEEARVDAELQRKMNRELYPEGDGELPLDAETRALLWLKPHPRGYVGHLPESFDLDEFEYDYHTCKDLVSELVCTACYRHPRKLLGTLSVTCEKGRREPCALLWYNLQNLEKFFGINPVEYCAAENRRRHGD